MSTRRIQPAAMAQRRLGASTARETTPWVRNPAWPALTAPSDTEQKLVGLYAVFPGDEDGLSNFLAVNCSAAYTVDPGDGTTAINTASDGQTNHAYDFDDGDLYNATVTLTDSGDLVTRTAHGYSNGMEVRFYRIVSTTGLTEGQLYYVINANTNNFQVSTTVGGSAVALTTNGSAALLPYKIATVTITPQAANNLTSVNLNVRHSTATGSPAYSTGWLDIALSSPNLTSLTIGNASPTVRFHSLERFNLVKTGSITSFSALFQNCTALKNVSINAPASGLTNMGSMFSGCNSLTTVPLFNTAAVTTMGSMFSSCNSLTTVPLFNTAAVTNMGTMFNGCSSLTTVPLFNTAAVTTMSNMFSGCSSLTAVPLFNTAAVTGMSYMFSGCSSLTTVPLFNTAAVTDMYAMFYSCYNLTTVPLFNTAAVTNMDSMFSDCYSLTTVPLFNTAAVTGMSYMFYSCYSLTTVPLFNTAAVTGMSYMFYSCTAISVIPAFNLNAVTAAGSPFANNGSLARVLPTNLGLSFSVATNILSRKALEEIFANVKANVTSQTLTITNNYGNDTAVTKTTICGTTAGSTTVTCTNTGSLVDGMYVTGGGLAIETDVTVASDVTADTLTKTAHGLANGTALSFQALGTTTGITVKTIYYVVNTAANTFQIALTAGGSAINLTGTNASGMTIRYGATISNIVANTSYTLSAPAASTLSSQTHTFRNLNSSLATLKGWSITF